MKQRAEITFEREETLILRQSGSYLEEFCPRCQSNVRLLTPEILANLTALSEREVFRLIEEGRIHFVESNRVYACSVCYGRSIENVQISTEKFGDQEAPP